MAKKFGKNKRNKIFIEIIAVLLIFSVWQINSYIQSKKSAIVEGTVEVHIIDVGQGDCTLIKTEDGNVLIDAGTGDSEEALSDYLEKENIDSFEYCIFTHPHEDHIGGADMIIENYDVENVIMSHVEATSATFGRLLSALENSDANIIEAVAGDVYNVGDLSIIVLAPIVKDSSRDSNNSSVVVRIGYGEIGMLFTGDAEHAEENDILNSPYSLYLDCDFIKMGHHGSSTSSSENFMDAVSPSLASISCGALNSYGHPHRETINLLNDIGVEYHRTDEEGSLVFICDGKTINIEK
ncbi:MAG: MBL fold metallo-hydrolase [Clostridia bacterium]|nr:MBL fold metallo-hydrolase [Clostridia bacterium]